MKFILTSWWPDGEMIHDDPADLDEILLVVQDLLAGQVYVDSINIRPVREND